MIRKPSNIVPLAAVLAAFVPTSAAAAPAEQLIPRPIGGDPAESATPVRVVQVQPSGGGFDFADAGIGAAAMLALTAIGSGAVLVTGSRRDRRAAS